MSEISTVLPEATLTGLACLVLVVDVLWGERVRGLTFWLSAVAVLATLAVVTWMFPQYSVSAFEQTFRLDPMAAVLKSFMLMTVLLGFFYARDYFAQRGKVPSEFFILALFAAIGMMVLISADSLLTVYLGL